MYPLFSFLCHSISVKEIDCRPLYMKGQMFDVEIQRILIDPGSAVNLLPYRTLRRVYN